jgi:cystathionine gamma-lyase/homocysteine desulfhydrase
MECEEKRGMATRIIHHKGCSCCNTGAVCPPIYPASTYKQTGPGESAGFDYSRSGNPTRKALEDYIAELERAHSGYAFSSGMAAISAALMIFEEGDHIVATEDLYGGSYRLLTSIINRFGIRHTFVDTSDTRATAAAIRPETKALYVETPTNPMMKIADLEALGALAKKKRIMLIVDNTFMSPLLQNPHVFGADVVVHSATKYLGGHSDLVMGLATARTERTAKRIKYIQNGVGAVPASSDCWLLMRGMKTLKARMETQQRAARLIADWLTTRPEVSKVFYPGLSSHPGYNTHNGQAGGPGAMISFYARNRAVADSAFKNVSLWTLAASLGAVESLIASPPRMTHATFPKKELQRLGINERLVRLSVGLEDPHDLIKDLEGAFKAASK